MNAVTAVIVTDAVIAASVMSPARQQRQPLMLLLKLQQLMQRQLSQQKSHLQPKKQLT